MKAIKYKGFNIREVKEKIDKHLKKKLWKS